MMPDCCRGGESRGTSQVILHAFNRGIHWQGWLMLGQI